MDSPGTIALSHTKYHPHAYKSDSNLSFLVQCETGTVSPWTLSKVTLSSHSNHLFHSLAISSSLIHLYRYILKSKGVLLESRREGEEFKCGHSTTFGILNCLIKVITKLPNSEQSYKGKVQTHNYINRQNQSTTGKLWLRYTVYYIDFQNFFYIIFLFVYIIPRVWI